MKGIYFSNYDLSDKTSGVSKKIKMQVDAFTKNNVEIETPTVYEKKRVEKIYTKLPLSSTVYDYHVKKYLQHSDIESIDFVYFRHNVFTRQLFENLNVLKKQGVTVLYEIPTYPYDRNEHKLKNTFMRAKDRKWREKCGELIDYIIDYSGNEIIFGAPTINISNGINPDFITPKNQFSASDNVNLIGVALMAPVHGFDRVIRSLKEYYDSEHNANIYFHIVGDGDSRKYLEELSKELNLSQYVIFYGKQYGAELDALYNKCDIGIGTLAIHRRYKNQKVSSLKTKEYSAKGLPFVTGEYDEIFEKNTCDFKYVLDQSDNAFNMDDLLEWYSKLIMSYSGKENLAKHIRQYAYDYLSWKDQIGKVISVISKDVER